MEKKKLWRKRFFEENEWLRYSHYHIKGTLFSRPTFQLSCISLVRASMTLLTSLISLYLLSTRARWLMDIGREQKSGQYRAQLCYNPENWLDFILRFIHDVPQFFKESSRKKGRIFLLRANFNILREDIVLFPQFPTVILSTNFIFSILIKKPGQIF